MFWAFLLYTAVFFSKDEAPFNPHENHLYSKCLKKVIPITNQIDGEHFVKRKHIKAATCCLLH
jgi:tellurite resistance protein TerC